MANNKETALSRKPHVLMGREHFHRVARVKQVFSEKNRSGPAKYFFEMAKKPLKTMSAKCPMRDMTFKNLTSHDKRRRILWASETINEDGILTRIHKYVIYIIKEVRRDQIRPVEKPNIWVLKDRNTIEKTEKFHLRMKGGLYCLGKEKCYFVSFSHTLKIDLSPSSEVLPS